MRVDQHMHQHMPKHPLLRHVALTVHTVARYEDPLLQAMALSLMPMDTIQARARDVLDLQHRLGDADTLHEEDIIAEELTAWFKRDFFSWYVCMHCCIMQALVGYQPGYHAGARATALLLLLLVVFFPARAHDWSSIDGQHLLAPPPHLT